MGKVVLPKGAAPLLGLAPKAANEVRTAPPADPVESVDQPDLRLMIQESAEAGGFIYTIVDRRTGKLIRRLSRDEVLRLRDKSSYAAGAVFDGKA